MKEIKAFVHRTRITDVVHELRAAGFEQLSIIDVMGTLHTLNNDERVLPGDRAGGNYGN